jgi:hypothetical protein
MLLWRIYVPGSNEVYLGLQVQCLTFWPILTKFGISRQSFIEVSSIKFDANSSSGDRAYTCWRTARRTDRQRGGRYECNRCFFANMRTTLKIVKVVTAVTNSRLRMERKFTWNTSHQHTWDNKQCSMYCAQNGWTVTHFQMNWYCRRMWVLV